MMSSTGRARSITRVMSFAEGVELAFLVGLEADALRARPIQEIDWLVVATHSDVHQC